MRRFKVMKQKLSQAADYQKQAEEWMLPEGD